VGKGLSSVLCLEGFEPSSDPKALAKICSLEQKIRLDDLKLQRLKGDKMQDTAEDCTLEEGKANSWGCDADEGLELQTKIRKLQTENVQKAS
jgi:hypothetical protein